MSNSTCRPHTFRNLLDGFARFLKFQREENRQWLWIVFFCFFLGGLGIHRFAVKRWFSGILYLLTFGFFGIGVIIDLMRIFAGKFGPRKGVPVKSQFNFPQRFVIFWAAVAGWEALIFLHEKIPYLHSHILPFIVNGLDKLIQSSAGQLVVETLNRFVENLF